MPIVVTPNESDIQTALRNFLLAILPSGIEIAEGQDNRVPEPESDDFVLITTFHRPRLGTNVDSYSDNTFVGSIAGSVLTITEASANVLEIGSQIFGVGVVDGTLITALGSGTGGDGTYEINNTQNISSEALASGTKIVEQSTQITIQLDVHGPNSADNAQIISTLFRDEYAVTQFATSGFDITPLYVDDPRQLPFTNDQDQVETRYVIQAQLQANQIVAVPQQFADVAKVDVIEVESAYAA